VVPVVGAAVLAAVSASIPERGYRAAAIALLVSSLSLAALPQPELSIAGLRVAPSLILEAAGVALVGYMLAIYTGYARTLALFAAVYAAATVIDAVVYFGSVDPSSLAFSAKLNAVVVGAGVAAATIAELRYSAGAEVPVGAYA